MQSYFHSVAIALLIIGHTINVTNAETYKWTPFCKEGEQKLQKGACTMKDYKKNIVPYDLVEGKSGVNVTKPYATVLTTINHQMVRDVNDKARTVTFDMGLTLRWTDHRIRLKNSTFIRKKGGQIGIDKITAEDIWKPEFVAYNLSDYKAFEDSIHFVGLKLTLDQTLTQNNNFRQHGVTVEYDLEAKVTMYCEFEFRNYPMDISKCMFRFGGQWSGVRFILYDPEHHFHRTHYYHARDFDITIDFFENSSIIGFNLELDRSIGSYIVRYYIPCVTIVIISQISFIVPMTAIPGRVVLMVTPFLTLVSIFLQQMVSITIARNLSLFLLKVIGFTYCNSSTIHLHFSRKVHLAQKWISSEFTFLFHFTLWLLLL